MLALFIRVKCSSRGRFPNYRILKKNEVSLSWKLPIMKLHGICCNLMLLKEKMDTLYCHLKLMHKLLPSIACFWKMELMSTAFNRNKTTWNNYSSTLHLINYELRNFHPGRAIKNKTQCVL